MDLDVFGYLFGFKLDVRCDVLIVHFSMGYLSLNDD